MEKGLQRLLGRGMKKVVSFVACVAMLASVLTFAGSALQYGDVTGDGNINMKDVLSLRKYLAELGETINTRSSDVNKDGSVNMKDVLIIRKFLAGIIDEMPAGHCAHEFVATAAKAATCTEDGNIAYWYCTDCKTYFADEAAMTEIMLPDTVIAKTGHTLRAFEEKPATCTEDGSIAYWYCSTCNTYFKNASGTDEIAIGDIAVKAKGHVVAVDEAVAPTYTETGLTEGAHCSVCGEVLVAQEIVPVLEQDQFAITYHVGLNLAYLGTIGFANPNPSVYSLYEELELQPLSFVGHTFLGWNTAEDGSGETVSVIPKGTKGDMELFAQWDNLNDGTIGLLVDPETGRIVKYEGTDEHVIIPDTIIVDNGDGTTSEIAVTGFDASVFAGNTTIKSVSLGANITEIPAGAFKGCTALETVTYKAVTTIGDEAFYGCENLDFTVTSSVTSLGENVFYGVKNVTVDAANASVAAAALTGGSKVLTLNLDQMEDDLENQDITVTVTDTLIINGGGKTLENVNLTADTVDVQLNDVTFTNNEGVPMMLGSEALLLNNVTVENAAWFVLVCKNEAIEITLQGENSFDTNGLGAVLCKDATFVTGEGDEAGTLTIVNGDLLTCGTLTGDELISMTAGETVVITAEDYEAILEEHTMTFDANGGTVETAEKGFFWGLAVGELPVPTMDYYTFAGWFTEAEDGSQVTETTLLDSKEDVTVYAHWTQNALSGWVLKSAVPEGATIENTKWKYTLRETTTSSNSSLSGWQQYNSTFVWSSYGAWSGWSTTAQTASDSVQVETQTVPATYKTQWHYDRWSAAGNKWTSYSKGTYSGYYCGTYQETDWLDSPLSVVAYPDGRPQYGSWGTSNANYWYNETTRQVLVSNAYTQYRYRVRSKIYTYYFERYLNNQESATYPSGDNISNVQEYVQYRAK